MLTRDIIVSRLAIILHLYDLGDRECDGPFPAIAVLCFHDAIEIFLQLALEHSDTNPKDKADFLQLFDSLKSKITAVENRDALTRLNDARKVVKHKSIEITRDESNRCRARARVFLEQNSTVVFGIDLFTVSMSDRISDKEVRDFVKLAEFALREGDYSESTKNVAIAFAELARRYPIVNHVSTPYGLDAFVKRLAQAVDEIGTKINLMSIGVEYKNFIKFRNLVPSVQTTVSGKKTIIYHRAILNIEDCEFCIKFVIDVATGIEKII